MELCILMCINYQKDHKVTWIVGGTKFFLSYFGKHIDVFVFELKANRESVELVSHLLNFQILNT